MSSNNPSGLREFLAPHPRKQNYWERKGILQSILALIPSLNSGTWLDVGCGTKPYRSLFESKAIKYWGTDFPLTFDNCPRQSQGADVFANSLILPFRDAAFDTVICTQVLEHVTEPQQLLNEIARVLRRGGTLLLSAPLTWPLHEEPHDYYRYTIYGLRHLFSRAGLQITHEYVRGAGFRTTAQMFLETL